RTRTPGPSRRCLLGDRARLQRRWRQHGVAPILELLLLVGEEVDLVLGVFELRAPEQRVERTDLDADPAVHAQGVVDGESVEDLRRTRLAAARGIVLLLVGIDVDTPVGALSRALVADGAILLLEGDDAPRARGAVRLHVRVR